MSDLVNKPPTPKELLIDKLNEWERARKKSLASYEKGEIDLELPEIHMRNLGKLIVQYKEAIRVLTIYGND